MFLFNILGVFNLMLQADKIQNPELISILCEVLMEVKTKVDLIKYENKETEHNFLGVLMKVIDIYKVKNPEVLISVCNLIANIRRIESEVRRTFFSSHFFFC